MRREEWTELTKRIGWRHVESLVGRRHDPLSDENIADWKALEEHDDYQRETIDRIRRRWGQTKESLDHTEAENARLRKDFRRVQDELVETADKLRALQQAHDIVTRSYDRNCREHPTKST